MPEHVLPIQCIYFDSYFLVQYGPELKLQMEFSVLLLVFLHLQPVQEVYNHQKIHHSILIANGLVPIALGNENHCGHVLVCILVTITQKCEAVIFSS